MFVCNSFLFKHGGITLDDLDLKFDAPHDGLDLNLPLDNEDHIADHGGINLNLEPPVNASHK